MKRKLAALSLSALLLSACSNLTQANYDKIHTGMAFGDVTAILGQPDNCSETLGVKKCVWGNDSKHIDINFVADKVLLTSARNLQ